MSRKLSALDAPLAEFEATMLTPACVVGIRTSNDSLSEIAFLPLDSKLTNARSSLAREFFRQLACYLGNPRFKFDLPVCPGGTEFQQAVWHQMLEIPAGRTLTYGEVAGRIRSSARAVGQACGANRLPIVIPCHRIVAGNGMGGFAHRASGFPLNVKRWLLLHERGES